MTNLPTSQNTSDSTLPDSEAQLTQISPFKKFNPVYLWRNNRWLFVIYTSIVIISLLALSLVGLFIYTQITARINPNAPTPTPTHTNSPDATHDSSDDKFFAQQPLTVLYYSFAQTTGNKNMYQATPNDKENRVLDIGFPDKYKFLTSPDGNWLLRWNAQVIERAESSKPQKFSTVLDLEVIQKKITSVVWQSDSASIAFTTTVSGSTDNEDSKLNQLSILPLATIQPVLIYEQSGKNELELIRFPNGNALYFAENISGTKQNLILFNPQNKQVERQFTALNQNNLLNNMQFSSDMQWGFVQTETEVKRYHIPSMDVTTAYAVNRTCEVGDPNNNTIANFTVAPSTSKLLVTENLTQCPRTVRNRNAEPTPTPPTQQITIYSINENKVIAREHNLNLTHLKSSSWSPTENYIWLTLDSQQSYMVETANLKLAPIPASTRQSITKERVFLIGWLQSQK